MTDEVREYAEKRILESNIRMVPGHYPDFKSKEHVDMWLKMSHAAFELHKNSEMEPDDMTEVEMGQYRELLQRLKKNKENVPSELLLTKYEKPYNKLRNDIADMTSRIVKDIALFGWKVERDEVPEVCAIVNSVTKESGIMRDVSHAVYQEQNVDKVLNCAARLRILVHQRMKECGL